MDLSDLPSQYTEDIETFRQVLGIPDPKHSMPVSNLVMGLNEEQEKQEARPKGPFTFLPANPALKEELTKWEEDFQNLNLTEEKFPKAPQATGKYYKMVEPCFEERMQELNRKFRNICISPRPQAAPGVRAPLHVAKELEHQARQNICTLNFSAVFNHMISECSSVMDRCRDSIKSTIKKAKHQIQKGADPERVIKSAYEKTRDYIDIWDKRIQIQQRALAYQSKAMTHLLRRDLHVMVCAGLMRRDAEMTNLHPDLGETRRQELRNSPFLPSPLFHSQLVQEGEVFLLKRFLQVSKSDFQTLPKLALSWPSERQRTLQKTPPMDNLSLVVQPLQTEVVSVGEVAGASSDPNAGVGVVETPQNIDSHRDPPVGGCLMQFRRAWVDENCSSSILNIIMNGYVLPFHLKPKLTRHPLIILENKNQQKDRALASSI